MEQRASSEPGPGPDGSSAARTASLPRGGSGWRGCRAASAVWPRLVLEMGGGDTGVSILQNLRA